MRTKLRGSPANTLRLGRYIPLLTAGLFLIACGGGGDEATDDEPARSAPAGSVTFAADLSESYEELAGLAQRLAEADGEKELRQVARSLDSLAARVEASIDSESLEAEQERLGESASSLAQSASRLELVAKGLARAQALRDEDREASEEAQATLQGAASELGKLEKQAGKAGTGFKEGAKSLQQAVGALGDDGSLSDETERLDALVSKLRKLERSARRQIGAVEQRIPADVALTEARAEDLAPDVIEDCTSQYGTVYEFSVRNITCAEAEPFVLDAIQSLAPSFTIGSFSCSILGDYGPKDSDVILGAEDIRCESGDQAFRFDFAD